MIRSFGLRDVFLVRGLQDDGAQLDPERAILQPESPLRAALVSRVPFDGVGATTYVMSGRSKGTRFRGFAQTRLRPNGCEADVIYLAPALRRGDATAEAWERLVTHLCLVEGAHGVQRLFAKLGEDDSDAIEVFRRAGFGIYTQELLLRLDAVRGHQNPPEALPLRPERPEDHWGLLRLYCQTAPHSVQQTECVSSDTWEATSIGRLNGHRDERYVWDHAGEIVGYIRLVDGRRGHWLKLLLHPDVHDRADDLIAWGSALLRRFAPRPIYCTVRAYDTPLQLALKRAGFQIEASLILLVKHMTRRVYELERRRVMSLERGVEPAISTHSPAASNR